MVTRPGHDDPNARRAYDMPPQGQVPTQPQDQSRHDTPARLQHFPMGKMVQCVKLGQEAEGLDKPPFKGPLGARLFDNVSKTAWKMWLEHSKMLINEFRLDLMSDHGQRIWMTECEKYFFGEGA